MGKPSLRAKALLCLCDALRTESEPSVRCTIAKALGEIGGAKAAEALCIALKHDNSSQVRDVIVKVLKRLVTDGCLGEKFSMSNERTIKLGDASTYIESMTIENGNYIQGDYLNMSQDLAVAATQIQELLEQLQNKGVTVEDAQKQVAKGMKTQAQNNSKMSEKLMKWGQSLGDATIIDVVKGVVKLAIRSAGLPLP